MTRREASYNLIYFHPMNCFRAGTRDKDIKLKRRTVRKHSLVKKKNYIYIYIYKKAFTITKRI